LRASLMGAWEKGLLATMRGARARVVRRERRRVGRSIVAVCLGVGSVVW
jgi:hypothetical protein